MSSSLVIKKAVPQAREFYPLNEPAIGTPKASNGTHTPLLFKPLTLRGVTFKNRIWVAPLSQHSADDGHATDWHLVHLGNFATHGVGAITTGATAVVPEGRVSPYDLGLWKDSQIEPLKRIVSFLHAHDTKIGVQLSHGGRKSSTHAPWLQMQLERSASSVATEDEKGWPHEVYAPSDISLIKGKYPDPKEMTEEYINKLFDAYVESAKRADQAGFDYIEIQSAYGYLPHQFLSPLSNVRTDTYGGQPLENRLRFTLEVVKRVREVWPNHKPLIVRIPATDWAEGPEKDDEGRWLQWGIEQTTVLSQKLADLGVDMIDVATGHNLLGQKIPFGPGYQVPFAATLKKALPNMAFVVAGEINEAEQAESHLQQGQTDVVAIGRELVRNPSWPLYAAQKLGVAIKPANQYESSWPSPAPSLVSSRRA